MFRRVFRELHFDGHGGGGVAFLLHGPVHIAANEREHQQDHEHQDDGGDNHLHKPSLLGQ
ncbi:hypothetical protein ACERK3_16270 [Phycisphaerales bacterium AB-hyl4]|uniref:Uncharacterized protein n=1 Tax=Natronomicrosphaera hydrolytica TaxID=3242702 RepID=A0ABV4U8A8_9BACT